MKKPLQENFPSQTGQIEQQHTEEVKAPGWKTLWVFAAIIVGIVITTILQIIFIHLPSSSDAEKTKTILAQPAATSTLAPTPKPIPFYEITIPHLGARSYTSRLGELEKSHENQDYTAYITSYNSDGLKIYALLTQPKGNQPSSGWPAIIFIHGYIPPSQYQTLVNYSSYVDYLARNGFVIFKIDLRGHGESEGEAAGGYYSGDYIIDTLNARVALQNSDFVNPNKIGLWGHSMSGNVIARALAAAPEIPAIVIWAGAVYTYTDFSEYSIFDNSYHPPSEQSESRKRRNEMFETYGQFNPESEFWNQVPMTNYLSGIKGAIQLNHAVNDPVVSIEYSRNLDKILDGTDIIHELNEYSSGGHNITGSSFDQAMQETVDFFKKYLAQE